MKKRFHFYPSFVLIFSAICTFIIMTQLQASADWGLQTLDGGMSTGSGRHRSLALDTAGRVHVAYTKMNASLTFNTLRYITNQVGSADTWDAVDIDAPSNKSVGADNAIFVDSAYQVHVGYYSPGDGALKYATSSAWPTWSNELVDTQGNVGLDTDIVLDASGGIHISYFDEDNDALKYAYKPSSGSWSTETVVDLTCSVPGDPNCRVGEYTSIGIDTGGNPHIIYYQNTFGYLKHATKSSGSWDIETVDSTIWAEHETSLVMDGDHLHVSFYSVRDADLMYATNATGSWVVETAHDNGFDIGKYSSIGLDASGNVHISYYDDFENDLEYTSNAGGFWVNQTVEADGHTGSGTSLAVADDQVHIGYFQSSSNNLRYARYNPDAPDVLSSVPADQAQGIPLNHTLLVVFSEAMDAATVNTTSFTVLDAQSNPVNGTVTYDSTNFIAQFTPDTYLTLDTTYTVTISNTVTDAGGTPMASNITFTFTTGTSTDAVAPSIENSYPANSATGIARNNCVMVLFSEEVDPATLTASTVMLHGEDVSGGGGYNDAVSGTIAYDAGNRIVVFSPDTILDENRNYQVTLTAVIDDLSGLTMTADHYIIFATGTGTDATPVTIASVTPSEGAIGVIKSSTVSIHFSEPVNPLTLKTTDINVSESTTRNVAYNFYTNTAILTLDDDFVSSKKYAATVVAGIEDLCANPLNPGKQWFFVATPGVLSTWPNDYHTGIDPQLDEIEATFYGHMDASTINTSSFVLSRNGTTVPGSTVTYDAATRTATLRIADSLTLYSGATYTVTLTTAVQDENGAGLEQDYTWEFTTFGSPSNGGSGGCFLSDLLAH